MEVLDTEDGRVVEKNTVVSYELPFPPEVTQLVVGVVNKWKQAAPELKVVEPSHPINYLNAWLTSLPLIINEDLCGPEGSPVTWADLQIDISDIESNPDIYKEVLEYLAAVTPETLRTPITSFRGHAPLLVWLHHHLVKRMGEAIWKDKANLPCTPSDATS